MKNNILKTLKKAYGQTECSKPRYKQQKTYNPWECGEFLVYFKKGINFDNLNILFKQYNYDVTVDANDNHIYINSKNSDDFLDTEYCVSNKEYQNYILEYEKDLKEDNNHMEKLENIKKFSIYHMFKTYTETQTKYMILLAMYIFKITGDVLVYDTSNDVYLNSKKIQELQEIILKSQTN